MSGKIESARNCSVSVSTQIIQAADRLGLVWSGDRIWKREIVKRKVRE